MDIEKGMEWQKEWQGKKENDIQSSPPKSNANLWFLSFLLLLLLNIFQEFLYSLHITTPKQPVFECNDDSKIAAVNDGVDDFHE